MPYYRIYKRRTRKRRARKRSVIKFYLALTLVCGLVGAAIPFVLEEGEKYIQMYDATRLVESNSDSLEKLKRAYKEEIRNKNFENLPQINKEKINSEDLRKLKEKF